MTWFKESGAKQTLNRPHSASSICESKPARPTDCKPDICDLAAKFCMLGATDDDLAGLFEVEPATIVEWIAGFPDFAATLKQGREIADATAAERLFQRAIGFSHEVEKVVQSGGKPVRVKYIERYPPDTTARVFWKNRQRGWWRIRSAAAAARGVGVKGYDVRLHRATGTNPPREPRTDGSHPFFSAIAFKESVAAGVFKKTPTATRTLAR